MQKYDKSTKEKNTTSKIFTFSFEYEFLSSFLRKSDVIKDKKEPSRLNSLVLHFISL